MADALTGSGDQVLDLFGRFSVETGKNVTSPGVCDDQPAFATEVENGQLIVVGFSPNP